MVVKRDKQLFRSYFPGREIGAAQKMLQPAWRVLRNALHQEVQKSPEKAVFDVAQKQVQEASKESLQESTQKSLQ